MNFLATGLSFDKKRFADDIQLFESTKRVKPDASSCAASALPSADFFDSNTSESSKVPLKTSQNILATDAPRDAAEVGDVSDFGNTEEIARFRKLNRIRVYGSDIPAPIKSFQHLAHRYSVDAALTKTLQERGLGGIDFQGRDLISCAPTGSGKTLAFILPIVQALKALERGGIQALIVSPTRELAQQIFREFSHFLPKSIKLGLLSKSNVAHKEKSYDILITTPMRLVHAIQQSMIQLDRVEYLVVDEADKLFDMNFLEQIDEIVAACTNPKIKKSLFSATITSHVETLANSIMKEPVRIVIGQKNSAADSVEQQLQFVGSEGGKLMAIRQLIQQGMKPPVIIFVESIDHAKRLFQELIHDGLNIDVIHAERTQAQREAVIKNFRAGKVWVLIATELIGRGLDFKGVNLVINYDCPRTVASYVHRIGRTGRAGRQGKAVTFFTRDDAAYLRSIANIMRESGCDVPDWLLKLPKGSSSKRRKQTQSK